MITPDYPRLMARYNRWQNDSLMEAAAKLSDAERAQDRGAFFRSIDETFAHILWADRLWLSRFGGCEPPAGQKISDSAEALPWPVFVAERLRTDEELLAWADGLTPADFEGDFVWYSASWDKELSRPRARLITHMFNHATHHRGQVHAMLTASGQRPEDTDIPFMPPKYEEL